jgi:hypothetical protein
MTAIVQSSLSCFSRMSYSRLASRQGTQPVIGSKRRSGKRVLIVPVGAGEVNHQVLPMCYGNTMMYGDFLAVAQGQ